MIGCLLSFLFFLPPRGEREGARCYLPWYISALCNYTRTSIARYQYVVPTTYSLESVGTKQSKAAGFLLVSDSKTSIGCNQLRYGALEYGTVATWVLGRWENVRDVLVGEGRRGRSCVQGTAGLHLSISDVYALT